MTDRTGGTWGLEAVSSWHAVAVAVVVVVAGAVVAAGLPLQGWLGGPPMESDPATETGTPPEATQTGSNAATPTGSTTASPTGSPRATPVPSATPAPLPSSEPLRGTRSLGDAAVAIEGEGADEIGYAVATGDLNGDGTPDVVVGAPFHNASGVRSGAVFVFFGPVTAGNLTVADADVRLPGESRGDWAGNSLAVADVSGDGVADLVVGAPSSDRGASSAGAVYVVDGGEGLDGTVPLGSADATLAGTVPGSLAGYSVAAANVTGSAAADVVVGAPRGDGSPGRVYVVDGRRVASTASLADATGTFVGERAGDEAGWRVAVAGNATGDGPAVVVGAPRSDAAGENAGTAYVLTAPFDGNRSLADAAVVLRGPADGALAGWSVAAPGDVDGDGVAELLVGAPFAGPGGTAYVVDGGAGERSLANATALRGAAAGDQAGWVVAGAGDVDCDGRRDLLVGAPGNDTGGSDAGAVYLVTDNGSTGLANATAALTGSAGDEVGHSDALATVAGRNVTGLVVGAPFGDVPQTTHVVYAGCPGS